MIVKWFRRVSSLTHLKLTQSSSRTELTIDQAHDMPHGRMLGRAICGRVACLPLLRPRIRLQVDLAPPLLRLRGRWRVRDDVGRGCVELETRAGGDVAGAVGEAVIDRVCEVEAVLGENTTGPPLGVIADTQLKMLSTGRVRVLKDEVHTHALGGRQPMRHVSGTIHNRHRAGEGEEECER